MADPRHAAPSETDVLLTQADFDAIVRELAVLGDTAADRARIAHLEELVRLASVVEGAADGAGLGSTVRVVDDNDRTSEYELIARRSATSKPHEITLASPVGQALWGARPGDVVKVALPTGQSRTLRVVDVRHGPLTDVVDRAA